MLQDSPLGSTRLLNQILVRLASAFSPLKVRLSFLLRCLSIGGKHINGLYQSRKVTQKHALKSLLARNPVQRSWIEAIFGRLSRSIHVKNPRTWIREKIEKAEKRRLLLYGAKFPNAFDIFLPPRTPVVLPNRVKPKGSQGRPQRRNSSGSGEEGSPGGTTRG